MIHCKCTVCTAVDPQGLPQQARTRLRHRQDDQYRQRQLAYVQKTRDDLPATASSEDRHVAGLQDGPGWGIMMDIDEEQDSDRSTEVAGGHDWGVFDAGDASEDDNDVDWEQWEELGIQKDGTESLFGSDEEGEAIQLGRLADDDLADAQSSDEDDSDANNEEITDLASDPLFISSAALFDAESSFLGICEDPISPQAPSAFDDHPVIRNAYINVFLNAAFNGCTQQASSMSLKSFHVAVKSLASSGQDVPGLSRFALTLKTVENRLGVSTDNLITYLFVCDACWTVHYPRELPELNSPDCQESECFGNLYTTKRLSNGSEKRCPVVVVPFVPPSKAIQRQCLQPGKVQQWQSWRGPDDLPARQAPLHQPKDGFDAFDNPFEPMKDITDGWGWRTIQAGLERRRRRSGWEVQDIDVHELSQRFVSLPNGLVFQMNIDW